MPLLNKLPACLLAGALGQREIVQAFSLAVSMICIDTVVQQHIMPSAGRMAVPPMPLECADAAAAQFCIPHLAIQTKTSRPRGSANATRSCGDPRSSHSVFPVCSWAPGRASRPSYCSSNSLSLTAATAPTASKAARRVPKLLQTATSEAHSGLGPFTLVHCRLHAPTATAAIATSCPRPGQDSM